MGRISQELNDSLLSRGALDQKMKAKK